MDKNSEILKKIENERDKELEGNCSCKLTFGTAQVRNIGAWLLI